MKQYRLARSRQLQCLDAINWLTRTLPPLDYHNVAVTMKVIEEFRRTRGGDRLPRISTFQGDAHALEYKKYLTHYGLPRPMKIYNNTWKLSHEPNLFSAVPNVSNSGPEFKLPSVTMGTNHKFSSSRGNLRVRLSYHKKDGATQKQRNVSLSSIALTKPSTKYRLEKK